MSNKVVQGLWIGSALSVMEQLSIRSFLMNGHEFHLYVYDDVKYIPAGTVVKDAAEILPAARIFQYKDHQTYSGFANFFRYKLLLERGGWWMDVDIVCLKPLDFADEYVFAAEIAGESTVVNNGAIKAPVGSDAMSLAWRACDETDPAKMVWGQTGPKLLTQVVSELSLARYVSPPETFNPLESRHWRKVLDASTDLELSDQTYAIHLWREMWRRTGTAKDTTYDPDCLYEQLKARYHLS